MCICKAEGRAMETQSMRSPQPPPPPPPPLDVDNHALSEFQGTSHWRSMALDTLQPDEAHKRFEKGRNSILQPCSLTTEGIELAQPAPIYRFLNRGPYKVSSLSKTWDDLDHSRPWIPAHVDRTFHNLTTDDIKGARPNPKNMKLGIAARGTNPLEPVYKLPSCKSLLPAEPKFLRDNLNVDDILGARSQHRVRFAVDSSASREVIEGSFPGWRPAHRRRFGKSVRDLCLQVQDINRPTRRMIRSGNAEAYLEIEGTQPKCFKQFQVGEIWSNHSLQAHDIEGTEAGSRTWTFNVQRRKEEGKRRTFTLKQQEYAEPLARGALETKIEGCSTELINIFKQLDRDNSGKLTVQEVQTALRRLQVGLDPAEFDSLATAFNTDMDGFVDYQKLLLALSPVEQRKHFNPAKLDSHVVALCLNQWIDRPWPDACIKPSNTRLKQKKDPKSSNLERLMNSGSAKMEKKKSVDFTCEKTSHVKSHAELTRETNHRDNVTLPDSRQPDGISKELPSRSCKFPLQLGMPFWPDEKKLQAIGTPSAYFSLPQDYKDDFREVPKNPIRPLSDDEKAWEKNVGGTLFTGEGNVVGHGSYMTGYDWSRNSPLMSRLPAKKRRLLRCQSLPEFSSFLELEGRMLTARNESVITPSKTSSRLKDTKSSSTALYYQRPMSASYTQMSKTGQFCSPRSVLISPMSSRSSWSPRSGMLSFESTPRIRELFGGSISARESLASRNQAERLSQRLQTVRKEDAAAVRSLF